MFILTENASIANHFIAELRDQQVQKDSMRFRRNMERVGELLAYEMSKVLSYKQVQITTPLGSKETLLLQQQPILATILRAGLPLFQGFINYFDKANSAFIGAYRGKHKQDESFEIELHYAVAPDLNDRTLILIDPMLATGKSAVKAYKSLLQYGLPAQIHLVAAIASREGVAYIQQQLPQCQLWLGTIDDTLNHKAYIVPGLGDAGDLAFGSKL
jgi:uracil phosphoribosyltransferase